MTLADNKTVIRRLFEGYNRFLHQDDASVMDPLLDRDVAYTNPLPGQTPGREGMKDVFRRVRAAFSDVEVNIDELIAEADVVAGKTRMRGRHTGDFRGVAPTGRSVSMPGLAFYRVRDGKVVEITSVWEWAALMGQLGG